MDQLATLLTHSIKPWLLSLALPPGPSLLLTLAGAGMVRRQPGLARALLLLAAASLWLGATEGGAELAQRALLGHQAALSAADIEALREAPAGTAILVLGGGARQQAPEYGGATLKPLTMERLRYGAWLARRTGLPLAFTGGLGHGSRPGDVSEGELASRIVGQEFGLRLLFAESRSRDTRENAANSLPLLQEHGIRQLVLVTHELHMPRAARAFTRADGPALRPAPVGLAAQDDEFSLGDWLPSSTGFASNRYVFYEWLGLRMGH